MLLFAFCFAAVAFPQSFSVGFKFGARLTDDLYTHNSGIVSESKRYAVGPTAEFKVWRRLGIEIDALYRRVGTSEFYADILGDLSWSRDRSNSWEFPILAKYRFVQRLPGPYVSGGYAFRHIRGSGTGVSFCCFNPYGPSNPIITTGSYTPDYENSTGLVVGGGMEFRLLRLRVSPEFRYTRWTSASRVSVGSFGYSVNSAQNQEEILFGITWP